MLSFFHKVIDTLDSCGIEYMLSGSIAMGVYVLPRATRDFDFIVHLTLNNVSAFAAHFKEGYYCDEDSIKDALRHHSMFNIIDHASGFKADFVILKPAPFRQMEFSRRQQVNVYDRTISVVTAEDLIISKLCWVQDLQSALQMEDIKTLNGITALDRPYIHHWLEALHLNTFDLPI